MNVILRIWNTKYQLLFFKIQNIIFKMSPNLHNNGLITCISCLVPVTEQWRDELQQLTKAIGFGTDELAPQKPQAPGVPERPKTQYSETTGRIIPPPSRAMSRGKTGSRQGRDKYFGTLQHIAPEPDMETMVSHFTQVFVSRM